MKPQTKKVLDLLSRREGACMGSFVHHGILRYSARIHELREAGYVISEEACTRTDHKGHVSYSVTVRAPENRLELLDQGVTL